jgi:sugar phosphate isomerase/epimerase/pimeloyl-ACP methyl ester carboxylesterase
MRLGIFAKTFVRPTLGENLDAVVARGLDTIQFNFACAGLPSMPEKIGPSLAVHIGREAAKRKLTVAAVSGTFNMIDPDPAKRQAGLRRLEEIASSCANIGTSLITLCTGSRDPEDMWRHHPQNASSEAWWDLLLVMAEALQIAERYKILLGIEPETANVISSAAKARQLLDEMKSPWLKIVMDGSNLFHPGDAARKEEVLNQAFDLLGGDIALAHAKDFRDTGKMEYVAPGKGMLPWSHYLRLLRTSGYCGALVMHSLAETEVEGSTAFLRKTMAEVERPAQTPVSFDFRHDGIDFHYQSSGRGVPFFFQHGLGADVSQPFSIFRPPAGFRLLAFDCRMHGGTHPFGPDECISIATFSDDLLAFMDRLKIEKAILGGISMGAAVALNFTLRHPERVRALVQVRPAWLDAPRKENVEVYSTMAQLIRQYGPLKGLEVFKKSPFFMSAMLHSPNAAKSLIGQFLRPQAGQTAALLERIPLDAPNRDRKEWRSIKVPVLVLANRQDPVHPFEYGTIMAHEIPGAVFRELTPKSVNVEQHNVEVQRFIEDFLLQHF